jgi:alginate O-acetyltransferase complex protein AlgI
MIFNSFHFLIFFIVVTSLYFALPHRLRWSWLLTSSCYFYMAFKPVYILILGFTIIIDYFAGLYIERSEGRKRKYLLGLSIAANIGVLAAFKYYNFLNDNLTGFLHLFSLSNSIPDLSILLPIGLSFHTFQAMSYTIEVYRGNQKAEKNFGIYSLYVMFYPQLVAGPIERPQNLIHQFYEKHNFDYQRVTEGLKLMVWGLFKKAVIADRLAMVTDTVFNDPRSYHGIPLIIATVFFAFQIFCDFSGYSDMAIGAAQVMGFKLMKNFDRPYFSRSISEFWKRWHISLSSWFRDYFYISLGGNRVSVPRWYVNLFLVFLVSGLWHGASWKYVIWGGLHGFYLVFGIMTKGVRKQIADTLSFQKIPRIYNFLQMLTVFTLVSFAWIFFRANTLSDAYYMITHMFIGLSDPLVHFIRHQPLDLNLGINKSDFIIALLSLAVMEIVHILQGGDDVRSFINTKPVYIRWAAYYAGVFIILFLGVFENRQFIYFQF